MSPALVRTTALAAALLAVGALAQPAWASWPFGGAKPATPAASGTAQSPAQAAAQANDAKSAPRKATAAERAAADRLDPLSRSAFWAREADADPTDVQAGVEFATALRQLGRYPESIQAAAKVLVLDPKNEDALLETARDFLASNQGFYALDPLKRAIAVAPTDWRPVSLMGVAREQNQQPDEAHAAYLQALTLSPDNPAVLSNLALWCAKRHDTVQAETLLRRAVAQPTATPKERQNLALLLGMEGKIAEAEHIMRDDLPPDVANNNLSYLRAVSGGAK